jgi:hypothetical protein
MLKHFLDWISQPLAAHACCKSPCVHWCQHKVMITLSVVPCKWTTHDFTCYHWLT